MAISTLPLLQNYQNGVPAPQQYNSRGPSDASVPADEDFTARHQAAYELARPFTDARGYVWRNRAAYDASLAALQQQQARDRDPVFQAQRFAQNNLNMGNRGNPLGFQTAGIPGTVVSDPSGPMTAERRAAMEASQREAYNRSRGASFVSQPGFLPPAYSPLASINAGIGSTTVPSATPAATPFTSLLSSFGSGRRSDLPYWMRR